jgi:hypothetical protein
MASPNLLHMIRLQLLYNSTFFQINHWIQWLILKKVFEVVNEPYLLYLTQYAARRGHLTNK